VVARLPSEPGVYRFRDAGGRVLYVGRATALRSRVGSYWSDLRGRRQTDLDLLAAVLGKQLAATLTRIAPLAG
jgi:excinuclease UvrABC nuclease subunit